MLRGSIVSKEEAKKGLELLYQQLQADAKNNDIEAQFCLGRWLLKGKGEVVPERPSLGFQYLTLAAKQGHKDAQYLAGVCCFEGTGIANFEGTCTTENLVKALEYLIQADERGHVKASEKIHEIFKQEKNNNNSDVQYRFGNWLLTTRYEAISNKLSLGFSYIELAAKQGHKEAQYLAGVCCFEGAGTAKEVAKALEYFNQAEQQGHAGACKKIYDMLRAEAKNNRPDAQYHLGRWLLIGKGEVVSKNPSLGFLSIELAAKQGHKEAQYLAGVCCFEGTGTAKNLVKALEYLTQALDKNHAEAAQKIREILQTEMKNNNPDAQYRLGSWLLHGKDKIVGKDERLGFQYLELAAKQGHKDGQYLAGVYCLKGIGTAKNSDNALEYFEQAAKQGHPDAPKEIYNILKKRAEKDNTGNNDPDAQYRFGNWLLTTQYKVRVKKLSLGFSYIALAADKGHKEAQYVAGVCYLEGKGTTKDLVKALVYFKKAEQQSHVEASRKISELNQPILTEFEATKRKASDLAKEPTPKRLASDPGEAVRAVVQNNVEDETLDAAVAVRVLCSLAG